MVKPFLITTTSFIYFVLITSNFVESSPQSGVVVPSPDETIDDPSKQVVVQHSVTVNVADPTPLTTHPPIAPLKTRVVVVHNNMVPVPIECFQPPDSGTCSKDLARIYYDHETRTCKPFSYTGCGGNANRFQSIKNCYRICHPYRYKIRPKLANKKSDSVVETRAKTQVIKIQTVPAVQAGGPSVRAISQPGMRSMGMDFGGPSPPYPPPYPPPPYPGRYPYGPLPPYPPYNYYGPQIHRRQLSSSHPIIEKQLVRSSDGTHIKEKVIGETSEGVPYNSGNVFNRKKK